MQGGNAGVRALGWMYTSSHRAAAPQTCPLQPQHPLQRGTNPTTGCRSTAFRQTYPKIRLEMHWPEHAYLQKIFLPKQGWQQAPHRNWCPRSCSSWCFAWAAASSSWRAVPGGRGKKGAGADAGRAVWSWRNNAPRHNRNDKSPASC